MSLKLFERIFQIIALVMFVIVTYMIGLKLTGHSPTVEDVLLGFAVTHFSLFIAFVVHSSVFQGRVTEFMSYTRIELRETKSKLHDLEQKIDRLQIIEHKLDKLMKYNGGSK
ncbi:MAG: hypothetical protein HY363_04725 [Candidatus Aenigmarchaeota archaeon]|nr:hypothetical protein [Candidatus Aenigmarchaeota archaeon]